MKDRIYDLFASRWLDGGTAYLYSDPHFGDAGMNASRGITDGFQIKSINSRVGKKDTLIILGDVGDPSCVAKLRGRKVLIMGNHDKGRTNYLRREVEEEAFDVRDLPPYEARRLREASKTMLDPKAGERERMEAFWEERRIFEAFPKKAKRDNRLFDEVYEGPLMIGDRVLLSHEPVDFPHAVNLHGHDHSGTAFRDGRHLNLCAEFLNYLPMPLREALAKCPPSKVRGIHEEAVARARANPRGKR